jgi:hypothetical protein
MKTGNGRWRNVPEDRREKMLLEVYDVMANAPFPTLIAFSTALHISKAVESESGNLRIVFEDMCLRFNRFLIRSHKAGNPNKGLLIIDDAHRKHYRDCICEFRREGVKGTYIYNIIDIPYFSASQDTRMLQLADFVAYAVYRYFEKDDSIYLDKIMPTFDRRDKVETSHADGLRHITKNLACDCVSCSWRRNAKSQEFIPIKNKTFDFDAIEPLG